MTEHKNPNYRGHGTIFKNRFKAEGDRKPDIVGYATVDGADVQIAGWRKPDGKISLLFENKYKPTEKEETPPSEEDTVDLM